MNGFNEFLAMGACVFVVLSGTGLLCLVWGLLIRRHVWREGVEELWSARRLGAASDGAEAGSGDAFPTRGFVLGRGRKDALPAPQAAEAPGGTTGTSQVQIVQPAAGKGPSVTCKDASARPSRRPRRRPSRITAAVAPLTMEQIVSGVQDVPLDALEPASKTHVVRNYSAAADLAVKARELRSESVQCLLEGRPERGLLLGQLAELTAAFAKLEAEAEGGGAA